MQHLVPRITLAVIIAGIATVGKPPVVVRADEDLNVLPRQMESGPTQQMLSRHLRRLAQEAFDRREAGYETLKSDEQIEAYQTRLRDFFFQQLGPLPERTQRF